MLLKEKRAETPPLPEALVQDLLIKEADVRKPFARQGTGFRDALIWETIRRICDALPAPDTQVVLVTNNHKDFCDKKGGSLRPDLRQDLATGQLFDIVPSNHHLLEHSAVLPLRDTLRVLDETFTQERLEELVDQAFADLHRLDEATFDEIMHEQDTIASEIYRAGDELAIRVTVDAECSFEGFADKSNYFFEEASDYTFLEDWNDYVFRASTQGRLHFTFSATFTEDTRDDVVLKLDDAVEV